MTGEFRIRPSGSGKGTNTVSFAKYSEEVCKGSEIILIWDKAGYPGYGKTRGYLKEISQVAEEKDWKIRCVVCLGRTGTESRRRYLAERKEFSDKNIL